MLRKEEKALLHYQSAISLEGAYLQAAKSESVPKFIYLLELEKG